MIDYDSMNVHELVERLRTLTPGYVHHENTMCDDVSAIESALRRAIIREASVGEITVKIRESGDDLSRPGDPNRIVTASEQFICEAWIPEGIYSLVKKEEPRLK